MATCINFNGFGNFPPKQEKWFTIMTEEEKTIRQNRINFITRKIWNEIKSQTKVK